MAATDIKKWKRSNHMLARFRRRVQPALLFLKGFIDHPAMVGSIIPSSPALVREILDPVDWSAVRLFVEYGPGVGTFTRPILDRLPPDARLIVIDTNIDFVRYLRSDISDHRLRIVHGSAENVGQIIRDNGFSEADYILSGLPFSTLPAGVADSISAETEKALRPGGTFLIYQYSRFVMRLLGNFDSIEVSLEWLNIPPCRIFRARKQMVLAQAA